MTHRGKTPPHPDIAVEANSAGSKDPGAKTRRIDKRNPDLGQSDAIQNYPIQNGQFDQREVLSVYIICLVLGPSGSSYASTRGLEKKAVQKILQNKG